MAQIDIKNIKRTEKERNNVHDKVHGTYSVFEREGKKYFQLDTFGRSNRELPGKLSQTIQLDKEAAQFLVDLLRENFDLD